MKKKRNHRAKKRRTKKYKGAKPFPAKQKQVGNYDYLPAEEYLTGYTSNINTLANQLNFLNAPTYQPFITNAIAGIQTQLSSFHAFADLLPKIDPIITDSPAFNISRLATIATAELSKVNTINDISAAITPKYDEWYHDAFKINSFVPPKIYSSDELIKSSQRISEIYGATLLSSFGIQASLAKATEYSLFAEKSLSSFKWSEIGNVIGLGEATKRALGESFLDFSKGYSDLFTSYGRDPNSFTEVSPLLSRTAPIEFYTGADLIESISTVEKSTTKEALLKNEIQYENEYSLQKYLPKVEPGLLTMWKGAIEAFNSNNPDKVRHISVSLRELFGHIMHILAPDEAIKKWSTDVSDYDNGKPTRKGRLKYICRNISHIPFNKFVEKDIQSTVEFIGIFQDGTHSIESGITPKQLIALKSKAETTIRFLLEIEFSANR